MESKEKRKENIFEAALLCFNETGYDKTNSETIAAKAGISKGGLFHYFKTKKQLFLELFQYRVNKYFDQMKSCIKKEDSPEDRLRILVKEAGLFLKQNEAFYKFCIEFLSMGVRDPEIRDIMTTFYKSSIETFRAIIHEGVRAGTFEENLDADKTARSFYLLVMGIFFTYFSINVDFDIFEQQEFQINRIIKGVRKA
jgi:TetR/AcrR family transcriptional regulator, fatty acid metabolism regulator protein